MTTTKIIEGNWNNGEYKYNVQIIYNGTYAGNGRFFRTREDAEAYSKSVIESVKNGNDKGE